jgi:hypothetical protein
MQLTVVEKNGLFLGYVGSLSDQKSGQQQFQGRNEVDEESLVSCEGLEPGRKGKRGDTSWWITSEGVRERERRWVKRG